MATKDISDMQVVEAIYDAKQDGWKSGYAYDLLMVRTGQCFKVCYRAMERAARRGLVDYGVSLRTAWVDDAGIELMKSRFVDSRESVTDRTDPTA